MTRTFWVLALTSTLAACGSEPSDAGLAELTGPGTVAGSSYRIVSASIEGEVDGRPVSARQRVGRGWVLDSSPPVGTVLEAGQVVRDEWGRPLEYPDLLTTLGLPGRLEDGNFAPGQVRSWSTPQIRNESGEVLPPPSGQAYAVFCFDDYTECLPQIEATTETVEHQDGSRSLVHDASYGFDGAPRAHIVTTWTLVDTRQDRAGI